MAIRRSLGVVFFCAVFWLLLPCTSPQPVVQGGSVWDEWDVIPGRLLRVEFSERDSASSTARQALIDSGALRVLPKAQPMTPVRA